MIPSIAQQKVFTEESLVSVIMKFHPVARQAANDVKIAKAGIVSARGGFDPKLVADAGRKEFGGITYYDHRAGELQVPTWYGIDLYAGAEEIGGSRVNPEETSGPVSYIGFSIQPLQNLLMDKRRAALLQARNFHQLSEMQRQIAVNDLLKEALYTYWDWWQKHHVHQTVKAALQNAEKRMALVRVAVELGDRPAIDTLEARTQVQAFQLMLSEAWQEVVKASLELSAYLWTEDGYQAELPPGVTPQEYEGVRSFDLAALLSQAGAHPELAQYEYKLKGLQVEKRLAFQSLLPDVKIRYNQTGYDLSKTLSAPWFSNYYRYGISLSIPLRLSEGRGEYQKAKLKMENTRLERAGKQVALYTKLKQYHVEWQQAVTQVSLQERLLSNMKDLQRGEETRFANGESSLFMINAREQKTIEAGQKLIGLKAKTRQTGIAVRWAAGILAN